MMFNEVGFLDRFAAAADAGFVAVEYLFPYAHEAARIAVALQATGLTQALFNLPPGNWDVGERGLAALPGRLTEFREGVATALLYVRYQSWPGSHDERTGRTPAQNQRRIGS